MKRVALCVKLRSADGENTSSTVTFRHKNYSVVALVALVVVGLVLGRPWEILSRPAAQTSAVHSEQTSSQEVSGPASAAHHVGGHLRSTTTAAPGVSTGTSKQTFEAGSAATATVPEVTTTSAAAATSRRTTSTRPS